MSKHIPNPRSPTIPTASTSTTRGIDEHDALEPRGSGCRGYGLPGQALPNRSFSAATSGAPSAFALMTGFM